MISCIYSVSGHATPVLKPVTWFLAFDSPPNLVAVDCFGVVWVLAAGSRGWAFKCASRRCVFLHFHLPFSSERRCKHPRPAPNARPRLLDVLGLFDVVGPAETLCSCSGVQVPDSLRLVYLYVYVAGAFFCASAASLVKAGDWVGESGERSGAEGRGEEENRAKENTNRGERLLPFFVSEAFERCVVCVICCVNRATKSKIWFRKDHRD